MYDVKVGFLDGVLATVKNNVMKDTIGEIPVTERILLKGGYVIDPKNGVSAEKDVLLGNGVVLEVADDIAGEKGDRVINCSGLLVVPGLDQEWLSG